MKKITTTVAFFIILCTTAMAQTDTATFENYLKANNQLLNLNQPDFTIFDNEFYNNQFFLLGESHGFKLPQLIDFALLKHLNNKAGVTTYVAEIDMSEAYFFNQYLQTGNEIFIKKVFSNWNKDTAQWANQEAYDKLKKIYQLNKILPAAKRIKYLGVDKIQYIDLVNEYLQVLLKTKPGAKNVYADSLALLAAQNFSDTKKYAAFAKRMLADNAQQKQFYKVYGKNYSQVMHVIHNLSYLLKGYGRDSVMFLNLSALSTQLQLQKQKLYGMFGFYHTLQSSYEKSMPFAALVKKSSLVFNKIVSLNFYTLESKCMIPLVSQLRGMMPKSFIDQNYAQNPGFPKTYQYMPMQWSNDNQMANVAGINDVKKITQPNTVTIFKLNGEGSPYHHSLQLAQVSGFQPIKVTDTNTVTTQCFQYMILLRGSEPSTPLQ
jgi:hypothetical protein